MAAASAIGPSRRQALTVLAAWSAVIAADRAAAAQTLDFDEFYKDFGALSLEFSDKIRRLAGQEVSVTGFMAPPLKAEAAFFVLTESPMALCPFCSSDADWPDNIIVAYLQRKQTFEAANIVIVARGRLEFGPWTDPETGFVSQLRLRDALVATA